MSSLTESNLIDVGWLSGAYGVKGWVKLNSQTEPSENIFSYQPWQLKTAHGIKTVEVISWRPHGKGHVIQIKGVNDRSQAEALCPVGIAVARSVLPALTKGEYYWHELEGCRVLSCYEGGRFDLGVVQRIMSTGANDVLVVNGDRHSLDTQERLLPYVVGEFVTSVDVSKKEIIVDWDPNF